MDFEHVYWSFINTWKAAVEDPEKLIFSASHYNIIDYILEYEKVTEYEKGLLTNLGNGLKEGIEENIICKLLSQLDNESLCKLIAIVDESCRDARQVQDPRPILEVLNYLFNSLNSDRFINVTRELIKKSISASKSDNVAILIFNLVRILLQRYSINYLKKLPEKTFTNTFLSSFKEIIIDNGLTRNEIQDEINLVLNDLESLLVDQSRSFNTNSRNSFFNELFHSNTFWLKDRSNILTIIKKMLRQSVINTDDRDAVVLEINRRICYAFLREFLYEYTPAGNKVGDLHDKNYFHNLSSLFVRVIYDRVDDRNIHGSSFQHTLISNSLSIFLRLLSRSLTQRIPFDHIAAKLETLINNQKSSGEQIDSFDFCLSCFRFIESVADELLDHVVALLKALQRNSFDNKEFLELLFEEFVHDLSSTGLSSLPTRITLPQYHQIIDGLFDKLSLSITKWKVYFEIGDLDLGGKSINTNEVTLYDARNWHLGERFEWDMRADLVDEKGTKMRSRFRVYEHGNFKPFGSNDFKRVNFRRNSARAMISVSAFDKSMAASEARKLLNKSLNMMVYEFTNEARLKHHPQITRSNEVVTDDDSISHYEVNSDPSDILKISQREQEILESYQRPTLIPRKDRLYRALSWFNAAFWESDNYAKYVLYWIGLEQLLDLDSVVKREGTKDKLIRIIPSITVTWRDDEHANYVIYGHLREIITALSNMPHITDKMEDNIRFKDWKRTDFIILENLQLLKQLVRDTSIEQSVTMLDSWINEHKQAIEVRTVFLRKKSEFEIAYLYAKRNTLVHEGLTLAGDLDYFVNLLRKLLTKVISVTLSFPSEQDWESISKEYNRPFSPTC